MKRIFLCIALLVSLSLSSMDQTSDLKEQTCGDVVLNWIEKIFVQSIKTNDGKEFLVGYAPGWGGGNPIVVEQPRVSREDVPLIKTASTVQ